jgi:hypothetical protein
LSLDARPPDPRTYWQATERIPAATWDHPTTEVGLYVSDVST